MSVAVPLPARAAPVIAPEIDSPGERTLEGLKAMLPSACAVRGASMFGEQQAAAGLEHAAHIS